MAGWKGHLVNLSWIPCTHKHTAGIRIVPDGFDHLLQLVYRTTVRSRPGTPLVTVDRTEVTVLVRPFVPDRDTMVLKVLDVRISGNKPEQLVDYGLEVDLLRGQEREAFRKVEPHLVAEDGLGADAGAVMLDRSFVHDPFQQVKVLSHATENCQIIASLNSSSGLSTVVGYSGLFGESGQCWHSIATPS